MNELQVKTTNIVPAKIEFNFDEIEKELDASLIKYKGLTFTEDATSEIRSVLAELRKGKNAVDRYRIDTKKELNKPVVEFEKKCKELNERFDSVIDPLDKQLKDYTQRERDEKQKQCEEIRTRLITDYELSEESAMQVDIQDQYLTKSRSLKQVEESMEFQVKNLKLEQDQKAANIEIVKTTVKLANAESDLSLSVDAYVRLLESNDVESVKKIIGNDANNEVERRLTAKRKEEQQAEKEQQEKLDELKQQETKRQEIPIPLTENKVSEPLDDLPFKDTSFMADPFKNQQLPTHNIYVTCSDDKFNKLKQFMDLNGIDWSVVDE